jgi:low affinity Fe/Cu permease
MMFMAGLPRIAWRTLLPMHLWNQSARLLLSEAAHGPETTSLVIAMASRDQPKSAHPLSYLFGKFASHAAQWAGHPVAFTLAVLSLLIWAAFGPFLNYSEGWQLVVNTGTTICTFLMVFVIQNSQNRDALAAQIKLDEIIRAIEGARNTMIDLEELTDEELAVLHKKFSALADEARNGLAGAVEEELEERDARPRRKT